MASPVADPLVVVVSRADVELRDLSSTLAVLTRLLESRENVRAYRERVDIAFYGYDDDPRELCEIREVREFVADLDDAFPYWLFFLSREYLGLQAIALCLLPPFLSEQGRRTIMPKRLGELVERRWAPALADLASRAGFDDRAIDQMLSDAGHYFIEGARRPMDPNTALNSA